MKIKDGDWLVISDGWRIDARPITKVTSKLVFWRSKHSPHQFRVRLDDVVFSGPEDIAVKLAERLQSSRSLYLDEDRKASDRQRKRDAELVERAVFEKQSTVTS